MSVPGLWARCPAHLRGHGHYPNAATLGVVGYRYLYYYVGAGPAVRALDPVVGRHYDEPGTVSRPGSVMSLLGRALRSPARRPRGSRWPWNTG